MNDIIDYLNIAKFTNNEIKYYKHYNSDKLIENNEIIKLIKKNVKNSIFIGDIKINNLLFKLNNIVFSIYLNEVNVNYDVLCLNIELII